MSKSEQDLKDAFAGESQANRKYLAFAKKADQEGFKQVAKLFRAAAEAETVHAHNHLGAMGGIKSTRENLEEALNGEVYEFQKMYPAMIEDCEERRPTKRRNRPSPSRTRWRRSTRTSTRRPSIDLGKNAETDYYVCQVCGNTVEGAAPDKCPICGAAQDIVQEDGIVSPLSRAGKGLPAMAKPVAPLSGPRHFVVTYFPARSPPANFEIGLIFSE